LSQLTTATANPVFNKLSLHVNTMSGTSSVKCINYLTNFNFKLLPEAYSVAYASTYMKPTVQVGPQFI